MNNNNELEGGFMMNRLTGETTTFTWTMAQDTSAIDADNRFCLRNKIGSGTFDPLNAWVDYRNRKGGVNNIGNIL